MTTDTSIREEIYKILEEDREICKPDLLIHTDKDLETLTQTIILKIEKRIDELGKAAINEYDVDYWAALRDMREELRK